MIKRLILAGLFGATAISFGTTPLPAAPTRFNGPRTACPRITSHRVQVKALATPVTGQELILELSATSRAEAGPAEIYLRAPTGALEPLDGELAWTRDLTPGQVSTWTTRVRVVSAAPVPLTAKVRASSAAPNAAFAEHHLTLYPFEVREGTLRPTWNESTLQPLSAEPLPTVTLPSGQVAIVAGASGRIVR